MKVFFRQYNLPYHQLPPRVYWGFLYYQENEKWQEFCITDLVVEKLQKRIKELFGNTAETEILISGFGNSSFRVNFKSQEDNDYFAILSVNGFEI